MFYVNLKSRENSLETMKQIDELFTKIKYESQKCLNYDNLDEYRQQPQTRMCAFRDL